MNLESALDQIAQIHRQMSLTRTFRGYRAATAFSTALIAVAAAIVQKFWLPEPGRDPISFTELWLVVAILCLVIVAAEMVHRFRRTDSTLQRELTIQAIEQFLPCIMIGGAMTFLICNFARQSMWLLPGLWSIFFGLGIFASRQLLPRAIIFVGAFYLLWGLICIGGLPAPMTFSPWTMAIPFGIGQSAAAIVLHFSLERHHREPLS
jgi:hypothetical protein